MKRKDVIALSIVAVLVLLLACGIVAYGSGYDTGYNEGLQETTTFYFDPPDLVVEEYEPPMTEEEQIILLLDKFSAGVETANITIEFDSEGRTTGSIHIYYNTKE